jgi:hypothetical protein
MSACFKHQSTGFLNLARERMGCDFLSKAEFAAGLDDDPARQGPGVQNFGLFLHWDLIGRERGTTNAASGSALAIHGSKTGSGDVVADSTRTQIAW